MKKNKKNRKFNFNVINAVILGVLISLSLTLPFMKGKQDNLQSTEVALTSEFSIESEGENHIINVLKNLQRLKTLEVLNLKMKRKFPLKMRANLKPKLKNQ